MGAITAGGVGVKRLVKIAAFTVLLSGCATSDNYAPVVDISGYEAVISQSSQPRVAPVKKVTTNTTITEHEYAVKEWRWPAHGRILATYSSNNKGIDIGGAVGQPVYAAASGKVVYAGSGLRGYGKLIILKHNSQYLSAYAYNSHLFVKEGDWVKQGQKIALMGKNNLSETALHFEIRRAGKPINPLNLLN